MARFITQTGGSGGAAGDPYGPYNRVDMYKDDGSYTWNQDNLDTSVPVRVYVWGAGGAGGSSSYAYGGGGGGLAIKEIAAADALNTSITVAGRGTNMSNRASTSSFGSHCSTHGGWGGNTSGSGSAGSNNYSGSIGEGGWGIGGDINLKGGNGGSGGYNSGSGYGGGGGSAPGPGFSMVGPVPLKAGFFRNGYRGGNCTSHGSGGGGGIGGEGGYGQPYAGGGGGGSAGPGEPRTNMAPINGWWLRRSWS